MCSVKGIFKTWVCLVCQGQLKLLFIYLKGSSGTSGCSLGNTFTEKLVQHWKKLPKGVKISSHRGFQCFATGSHGWPELALAAAPLGMTWRDSCQATFLWFYNFFSYHVLPNLWKIQTHVISNEHMKSLSCGSPMGRALLPCWGISTHVCVSPMLVHFMAGSCHFVYI